jgi:hypothetical protein
MATKDKLKILDGSSHFDIIVSVNHGDSHERKVVVFKVSDDIGYYFIETIVNGNEREDGSGLNWLLKGYIKGVSAVHNGLGVERSRSSLPGVQIRLVGKKFEAFYTLRDRTGHLNIVE